MRADADACKDITCTPRVLAGNPYPWVRVTLPWVFRDHDDASEGVDRVAILGSRDNAPA